MKNVLKTTKAYLPKLKEVQIDHEAVSKITKSITKDDLKVSEISLSKYEWDKKDLIELTFLFNTINFCFWSKKGEEKWTIEDDNLDGAIALFRCLENELKRDSLFLHPNTMANLDGARLSSILRGNVEIPLFEERLQNINSFGTTLIDNYSGSISNLFKAADDDAYKLAELLIDDFECFDDVSVVGDIEIAFYKRAQLNSKMVHDVLTLFGEPGLKNLNKLTAFADYKIPQKLRSLGVLKYSKSLAEKIDNYDLIEAHSAIEIELRVATIWAVEYIQEALRAKYPFVTSSHVDNYLWLSSQKKSEKDKPYHRTLTTAY